MRDIKTLLADDHAIVMEGIKEVLSADEEISVVGTVANGEEVLRFIRKDPNNVNVVVLARTCRREALLLSLEVRRGYRKSH